MYKAPMRIIPEFGVHPASFSSPSISMIRPRYKFNGGELPLKMIKLIENNILMVKIERDQSRRTCRLT